MTALARYIRESQSALPMWALCPVRGCLNFAPLHRGCAEHWEEVDRRARFAFQAQTFKWPMPRLVMLERAP